MMLFSRQCVRHLRHSGSTTGIGALLQVTGVLALAAGEISAPLSALVTGSARIAWVEERMDTAHPLGELLEGGLDAAAAYVASWPWRSEGLP
jgi:hypothetical protein